MIKQITSVNEVKVGEKYFVFFEGRFEDCFTLHSEPKWNEDIGSYFAERRYRSSFSNSEIICSFSLRDYGIQPNTYNDRKTFSYDSENEIATIRNMNFAKLQEYIQNQCCCRLSCCPFRKPVRKFKTIKKEFSGSLPQSSTKNKYHVLVPERLPDNAKNIKVTYDCEVEV